MACGLYALMLITTGYISVRTLMVYLKRLDRLSKQSGIPPAIIREISLINIVDKLASFLKLFHPNETGKETKMHDVAKSRANWML